MVAFLVRRIVAGFLTLFVIATLCFAITRLAPGSPFTTERAIQPEVLQRYEEYYGLNKPIHVQYARALSGYFQGRLGPSTMYRTCRIAERSSGPDFVNPSLSA